MTHAQAVARLAHPLRAVEAEQLRARGVEPDPALSTRVIRRQEHIGPILDGQDNRPLASFQGRLHRLGQSRTDRRPDLDPIDHNLDVVLDLTFKRQVVGDRHQLAVHPGAKEPGAAKLGEEILVFPLLPANHGGEHGERRALGELHRAGHNLLAGQRRQRPIAIRAMAGADPGEQYP